MNKELHVRASMTGQRRFRFGAVAGFGRSGQEWAANAHHIEQLGFSTLLCPDGTGTFAPFQALSAAAAATSTLRLGTYVLASPLRTPGEVDTLLRRRDRAAVSYVSVNAQFADRFAPVIELLADA
jgi:hypothetical protein